MEHYGIMLDCEVVVYRCASPTELPRRSRQQGAVACEAPLTRPIDYLRGIDLFEKFWNFLDEVVALRVLDIGEECCNHYPTR